MFKSILFIVFIFLTGIIVGRLSIPANNNKTVALIPGSGLDTNVTNKFSSEAISNTSLNQSIFKVVKKSKAQESDNRYVRKKSRIDDRELDLLFRQLMAAMRENDVEEQNILFAKMERLSPRHPRVFQAKVMFLQDDGDWQGAYEVLKECVEEAPKTLYCLRRMVNIRSSLIDDKLKYGKACLELKPSDSQCLMDYASALLKAGDPLTAKKYFELALSHPENSMGDSKKYILFQYGLALEKLNLFKKANAAYLKACNLKMKAACVKVTSLD